MTILVFNIARMGDLIESIPAMIALRRAHPEAHITLAVIPECAWAARLIPGVDTVCFFDTRAPLKPFCEPAYGAIYNFSYSTLAAEVLSRIGASTRTGLLLTAAHAPQFSDPATVYLWNFVNTPNAPIFNFSDLLRYSVAPGPMAPSLYLAQGVVRPERGRELLAAHGIGLDRPLVCMQTSAADPYRVVQETVFSRIGALLAKHCQVAVLGSAAERARAERIAHEAGAIPLVCDLDGLLGVLSHTALLVTCNTGPMHLAAALGVRCLVLSCGTSHPAFDGPYGAGHVIVHAATPCHPCRQSTRCADPVCVSAFQPEHIAAAASAMAFGKPVRLDLGMRITECDSCGCRLNGDDHLSRRFFLSLVGGMPLAACGESGAGAIAPEIERFAGYVAEGAGTLRQAIAVLQQGQHPQDLAAVAATLKKIDVSIRALSCSDPQWQSVVGFFRVLVENCVAGEPQEMLRELYAVYSLYSGRLRELAALFSRRVSSSNSQ